MERKEDFKEKSEKIFKIINQEFFNDPMVNKRGFPVMNTKDLFYACSDGVLLCKLINSIQPGISEKKLTLDMDLSGIKDYLDGKKNKLDLGTKNVFHLSQNFNSFIAGAHKIPEFTRFSFLVDDVLSVNIEGLYALISIILQYRPLIKLRNLKDSINSTPFLPAIFGNLIEKGESLTKVISLEPGQLLLRWINHHLKAILKTSAYEAASTLTVPITNWAELRDGLALLLVLRRVGSPDSIDASVIDAALSLTNKIQAERIHLFSESIEKLNCGIGVTTRELASGDVNAIMCLTATLFARFPVADEGAVIQMGITVEELKNKLKNGTSDQSNSLPTRAIEDIRKLEDSNHELNTNVATLEAQNKALKAEVAQLKEKLSETKDKLAETKASNKAATKESTEKVVKETITKVDDKLQAIKDQYDAMLTQRDNYAKELQDKIGEYRAQNETQRNEIQNLNEQIKKLHQDLKEREKSSPNDEIVLQMQQAIENLQKEHEKELEREREREKEREAQKVREKEREERQKEKEKERQRRLTAAEDKRREKQKEKEKDREKENERNKRKSKKTEVPEDGVLQTQVSSLSSQVKDLTEQLEEERKAFAELMELNRQHDLDSEKVTGNAIAKRQSTDLANLDDEDLLEETLTVLIENLGQQAFNAVKLQGSLASKIKLLVDVLLDVKGNLSEHISNLESKIKKNDEINMVLKNKLESYVLEQMRKK